MNVRILPPALWTLYRLNVRARLRKIGRSCRTVRGALGLLLVLLLFGFMLSSFIFQRSFSQPNPHIVRDYVPLGMLAMCVMNLVFSKSGQGIAFWPAEVDFLFPGPFKRRELLLYRLVGNSLILLPTSLMFSMFVYPHVTLWLAGFAGVYLALQFFTLFQIVVGLFAGSVRERLFSRTRLGIALLIFFGLVISLLMTLDIPVQNINGHVTQFREAWPAKIILYPFDMFARTIAAVRLSELAAWGLAAASIDVLMVGLVLWLDLDFREASLKTSQRIQERLQSARSGRLQMTSGKVNVKWLRYIGLPWLCGAGPVASYQLTLALRSAKGILPFILLMLASGSLPIFFASRSTNMSIIPAVAAPGLMFLLMVFPQFLQFDFRGDVDRMDLLKTLPLSAVAITCGELLAPTVFLLVIELFAIGLVAALGALPAYILLSAVMFLPMVNLIVFAVENLVWLIYPHRIAVAGAADVQAVMRQMLLMMLKMLVLGLVFGAAAGVGAIAWWITDWVPAGIVVAWFACATICAGLVTLVAGAFRRFDPAEDTPG